MEIIVRILSYRYLAGMKEYEVELQFTSALLGFPDRTHDEHSVVDGNDPVYGDDDDHMNNLLLKVSVEEVESSVKVNLKYLQFNFYFSKEFKITGLAYNIL